MKETTFPAKYIYVTHMLAPYMYQTKMCKLLYMKIDEVYIQDNYNLVMNTCKSNVSLPRRPNARVR